VSDWIVEGSLGVPLSASQRRRLAVVLRSVEAALGELDRAALPAPGGDHLHREAMDVPPDFPDRARAILAELRRECQALVTGLALRPFESSRRRHLAALCTTNAIELEDSTSRSLRGYGAVHPEVAATLDPAIQGMERRFLELAALLMKDQTR
jgi:hypothetical protein